MPVTGKNPWEPDFQDDTGISGSHLTLKGIETPRGAPANTLGQPPYRIGGPIGQQTNWLYIIAGGTQTKFIGGSGGYTFRNNADTLDAMTISNVGSVAAAGNIQTAPGVGPNVGQIVGGGQGFNRSEQLLVHQYTGIADNTATPTVTISIPNAACCAFLHLRFVVNLGAGGAIGAYEAAAIYTDTICFTRTPGVAAVASAATAVMTGSVSVAGGATITLTVAMSTVSGAVGATNTFTVNVTIAHGTGASTNHQATVEAVLITASAANPGITITA